MEVVNTFSGMDMDVDKLRLAPTKYRSALNVRLETDKEGTRGALINLGGNTLQLSFPTTSNVSEVTLTGNAPISFTFTVNGINITITNTSNSTFFKDVSTAINANLTLQGLGITSAYSLVHTTIWSPSGLNVNVVGIPAGASTNNAYILSQSNLQPIGWTTLRDDIIFLTTNSTAITPNGTVGQIWKYTYNPGTNIGLLTLLYNNIVDFSTYFPIAQTAIVGRYENYLTKKIYWTDFNSQLRNFNTADPQGFALDPADLSRKPDTLISRPILQSIGDSGGNLIGGNYQAVYRLKLVGGSVTRFFELSNPVSILSTASSVGQSLLFIGDPTGTVTSKTITWQINPVDTKYDRIEIAIVKRLTTGASFAIEIIREDPIPTSGVYNFTYTGHELTIPIDLNTLVAIPGEFTHCKTISSKDNLLLVGNVRSDNFDVDFDARAYRFNQTPTPSAPYAKVEDSQGLSIQIFPGNWGVVPTEHDAINPNQTTQNNASYRFQADGITLGGEGPNIKYTFKKKPIVTDQNLALGGFGLSNEFTVAASPLGFQARYVNAGGPNEIVDGITYPNNGFYDSFVSPYKAAIKGYQHDETYRFGIVFYSASGTPSFVKWIGDIKMPIVYENGIGSANYSITDIQTWGTFHQQVGNILYPEFTVNIPSNIKSQISGYSIVRVRRTNLDKTVLAAGTLHPTEFDSAGNTFYAATPGDVSPNASEVWGFKSPEFSFGTFGGFQTLDSVKVMGVLANSFTRTSTAPAVPDEFKFHKNYTMFGVSTPEQILANAKVLQRYGQDTVTSTNAAILNRTNPVYSVVSVGEHILILDWQTTGTPILPTLFSNKYYALYKRNLGTPITSSQYGGSSYTQRSSNLYEDCGQYQPVPYLSTQTTFVTDVFGGDIYTTVWDTQRIIKAWIVSGVTHQQSVTYWFPTQSTINTEWRWGTTVNTLGLSDNGTGADLGEDCYYNPAYEIENDVKPFIPKPVPFKTVNEFDSRIWASQIKINGETQDSWLMFGSNDYWDVESIYGPISSIFIYNNQLMFLQDKAFGIEPVNQRVVIQDNAASTLQLGTGDKLTKHTYLTTKAGSKHQNGVVISNNYIYFFDTYSKRIYRFGQGLEQQSELEGISSYLENNLKGTILTTDNPVYKDPLLGGSRSGVLMGVDKRFNEVIFTFYDADSLNPNGPEKSFTIVYNELLKVYQGFTSFKPSMYIYDQFNLFSPNTTNPSDLWIHNQSNYGSFYGIVYPSTISLIINPSPEYNKVFDNISFYSEIKDNNIDQQLETFSSVRFSTDFQNSDLIALDPILTKNIKRKERTWNTKVARNVVDQTQVNMDIFNPINLLPNQLFKNRLRDKAMTVDLTYSNLKGYKLIFHYLRSLFRISQR